MQINLTSNNQMKKFQKIPLTLFLLVFAGIIFIWKKDPKKPGEDIKLPPTKIRKGFKNMMMGKLGMCLFFTVFLAFGLGFGYLMLFKPLYMGYIAKNWDKVKCEIVHSKVKSHSDGDGTTYSVDILFAYDYKGQLYKSNTYNFETGSTSGYEDKKAVINKYPPRHHTLCYVNPEKPSQAVISRDMSTMSMLFSILPMFFILIGLGGIIGTIFYKDNKKSANIFVNGTSGSSVLEPKNPDTAFSSSDENHYTDKQFVLQRESSAYGKIFKMLFSALIWNGLISIFLGIIYNGFKRGEPEWFLTFFMIPFVLIGLFLIFTFFSSILQSFNPVLKLTISPGILYPGCESTLKWECFGSASRISSLEIKLIGEEETTDTHGENNRTNKSVFADIQLIQTDDSMQIEYGSCKLSIDSGTMHSLNAVNNCINWYILVKGDIKFWPDINEKYPVTVMPIPKEHLDIEITI